MPGPPGQAQIFVTAGLPIPSIPLSAVIRSGRLDSISPALHIPRNQAGKQPAAKQPAAAGSRHPTPTGTPASATARPPNNEPGDDQSVPPAGQEGTYAKQAQADRPR
jgi:hypothetical protein